MDDLAKNINNLIASSPTFSGFYDSGFNTNAVNAVYTYPWWGTTYVREESKTEQAYKILRALMKANVLEIKTLNQFFSAMDEIIKAL